MTNLKHDKTLFHGMIEKDAQDLKYGEITVYVVVKNGLPVLNTLNVTKRRRYKIPLS